MNNKKFNEAIIDPSAVFDRPSEVLAMENLSTKEKIEILKRWEQDARELAVAEEEGMTGTGNGANQLDDIINAIAQLDPTYHQAGNAPNKQGNVSH